MSKVTNNILGPINVKSYKQCIRSNKCQTVTNNILGQNKCQYIRSNNILVKSYKQYIRIQ